MTWNSTCGNAKPAWLPIAGFFAWAYSPAAMSIIPNPATGKSSFSTAGVTHLTARSPRLLPMAEAAGFGTGGWPACLSTPLPVEKSPPPGERAKSLAGE